jgi:hypothetical protein
MQTTPETGVDRLQARCEQDYVCSLTILSNREVASCI